MIASDTGYRFAVVGFDIAAAFDTDAGAAPLRVVAVARTPAAGAPPRVRTLFAASQHLAAFGAHMRVVDARNLDWAKSEREPSMTRRPVQQG